MNGNGVVKQLAITAGLLVMGLSPSLGRAQTGAPAAPAYQDQNQAEPAQHPGHKHGTMAGLNLTEDQKTQMKQIHESAKTQADAVNGDASLSADQKQEKLHQIHRHARVQMVEMLTPEQRQQMRKNAKARRAARHQNQQQQPQPQAAPQTPQ